MTVRHSPIPPRRRRIAPTVAAALATGLVAAGLAFAPAGAAVATDAVAADAVAAGTLQTVTFRNPEGAVWVVPAGVTSVEVSLAGNHGAGDDAGDRDTLHGTFAVQPGDRITAYGATAGGMMKTSDPGRGFRNGGKGGGGSNPRIPGLKSYEKGESGGGGGGAAAITLNGTVMMVAAGGGGGGATSWNADGHQLWGAAGGGGNFNAPGKDGRTSKSGATPPQGGAASVRATGSAGNGASAATATGGGGGGGGGGGYLSGDGGQSGHGFLRFESGAGGGGGSNYLADGVTALDDAWIARGSVVILYRVSDVGNITMPTVFAEDVDVSADFSLQAAIPSKIGPSPRIGTVTILDEDDTELAVTRDFRSIVIPKGVLRLGAHTLTAVFTPDDGSDAVEAEQDVEVRAAYSPRPAAVGAAAVPAASLRSAAVATATTVTLPTRAPAFGSPFAVDVSVTATPVVPLDGEPVVVLLDGVEVGSGVLSADGTASVAMSSAIGAGTHTVQALVPGNAAAAASESAEATLVVETAAAMATVSAAPSALVYGEPIRVDATVAPLLGGSGTPSGLIALSDGVDLLAFTTLDADGSAAFTDVVLPPGTTELYASYAGDDNFADTVSSPVPVSMTDATTSTDLTVTPAAARAGQATTAEIVVTAAEPSTADPHGIIALLVDGELFAETSIGDDADQTRNDGVARFTVMTDTIPAGEHTLTAHFLGTEGFGNSLSGVTTITRSPWTTAVAATAGTATGPQGDELTVTAEVSLPEAAAELEPGAEVPIAWGSLQAYVDGSPVGAPVEAGDTASVLSLGTLAAGTHSVRIVYTPDSDRFLPSEAAVTVTVSAAASAQLARTGAHIALWPVAGGALLLSGLALALRGRHRTR